jgi:hypothetical protein
VLRELAELRAGYVSTDRKRALEVERAAVTAALEALLVPAVVLHPLLSRVEKEQAVAVAAVLRAEEEEGGLLRRSAGNRSLRLPSQQGVIEDLQETSNFLEVGQTSHLDPEPEPEPPIDVDSLLFRIEEERRARRLVMA